MEEDEETGAAGMEMERGGRMAGGANSLSTAIVPQRRAVGGWSVLRVQLHDVIHSL